MSQTAPKVTQAEAEGREPVPPVSLAPVASPARRLQEELERAMAGAPAAAELHWSPRRAAAFVLLVNALFWWAFLRLLPQLT